MSQPSKPDHNTLKMKSLSYHLATRKRLKASEIRTEFHRAAPFHDEFYRIHGDLPLRAYPWPMRPLYEWSRRLEYPWVINKIRNGRFEKIVDAGSGVTFLPYLLARELGAKVDCIDNDASYSERFDALNRLYGTQDKIQYYCQDITQPLLPRPSSYDCVICISVIEHLPPQHRRQAVQSLLGLLDDNGTLLLTIDVALDDNHEGVPYEELDGFIIDLVNDDQISIVCNTMPGDELLTQRTPYSRHLPYLEKGRMYRSDVLLDFQRWRRGRKNYLQLACALIEISL